MALIQIQKLACNFCGKTEGEAPVLITGGEKGRDAICNECVEVCVDVITKHAEAKGLTPEVE